MSLGITLQINLPVLIYFEFQNKKFTIRTYPILFCHVALFILGLRIFVVAAADLKLSTTICVILFLRIELGRYCIC